jgi:hypothetical protein
MMPFLEIGLLLLAEHNDEDCIGYYEFYEIALKPSYFNKSFT